MRVKEVLRELLKEAAEKALGKLPAFDVVEPPHREFGDFSTPLPLQMSRKLGKDPIVLARRIKTELDKKVLPEWIREVSITRPGYVNFLLDSHLLAKKLFKETPLSGKKPKNKPKVIIEHTQVNPNKAAHVGHVRNAVLGDSLARLLRFQGVNVEVINYIDNTGVQVADSYLALKMLAGGRWPVAGGRLDHLLWELYPKIQKEYEEEPELLKERVHLLQLMEEGKDKEAKKVLKMTREVVANHLKSFASLGVFYNLLVWEGDVLRIRLWERVFNWLKRKRLIIKETSGPNKGAWVVRFGTSPREDKILVRSDGTTTYTAKDLAYELWKFNKAGLDFSYAVWGKQENGERLWTTKEGTDKPARKPKVHFGHGDEAILVIDARQSYPQMVIKETIRKLGFKKEAESYHHLAYGVVSLSAQTMRALGHKIEPSTEEEKASFTMSGRAGIGVKADDLVDKVKEKIGKINRHLKSRELELLARAVIRYYLLSVRPEKEVVFDIENALQTDGSTGAYLEYSYARASNILNKVRKELTSFRLPTVLSEEEELLLKKLSLFEEVVSEASEKHDPSLLCDYLWQLSSSFAKFYETNPVLKAPEPQYSFRLRLVKRFRELLETGMELLGIVPLEKI